MNRPMTKYVVVTAAMLFLLGITVLLACGCRKPNVAEYDRRDVERQVLTMEMIVESTKRDASGMYMIHSDGGCPKGWKFKKDAFTLWVPEEHHVDGCYVLRNINHRKPLEIHNDYLGPKEALGIDIPRIDDTESEGTHDDQRLFVLR